MESRKIVRADRAGVFFGNVESSEGDTLSLEEFVGLTRNAYGGDLIASLLELC